MAPEEGPPEQPQEALVAELLQEAEEPLDVRLPGEGAGVDELGEVRLADGSELEDALAHEVEPLALARHRGELLGPLAGEIAGPAVPGKARMGLLEAPAGGGDPHPVGVEVERGGDAAGAGRHGVADPLELHHRSGADLHGEAQPVLGRGDRQRLHPLALGFQPLGGNRLRGPGRALFVAGGEPLQELARQVVLQVGEAAGAEEALLHPADQVLHRAFLLRAPGCAQLDGEAVIDGHLRQRRVPPRPAVLVAPQDHRLRIVEDHPQRDAARVLETGEQGAHQRLDALVGNDHHPHPARVLEPVGREVDALPAPVQQPHVGDAEVELRELAGHALEAHHQLRRELLLLEVEDPVEGALAQRGALLAQLAQQLQRWGLGILGQKRAQPLPHGVREGWPARATASPHFVALTVHPCNGRLLRDPLHGALRDAHLLRHLLGRQPRPHQRLHYVSVDHPKHPPSPPASRDRSPAGNGERSGSLAPDGDRI
jgi:hypothetical protein